MAGGFGTRPEDLEAAAARFDEAARIAADACASLRSSLSGLGDVAGDDEQGRTFAARYDPKAAEGMTAIEQEATGLGALGGALRSTAADYRAGEGGAAAGFGPR
ncbi:hypothetical protein [Actinomycetospora termitidis]|uniref:Uncharacterized protein n=1 Tax=Actinomycetospora termitidis TaxID=3053470 RepID=A0ABT7MHI4_9PSEU|nr:hypothetical protein [Actinomycetospora sp. Odt1-22]MDL5160143.1 hypothetical protein [Actinomycetospora sp. Odt1-22]